MQLRTQCADTVRESRLRVEPGEKREKEKKEKNPLPHLEIEPASVLRLAFQFDALPTEL